MGSYANIDVDEKYINGYGDGLNGRKNKRLSGDYQKGFTDGNACRVTKLLKRRGVEDDKGRER